MAVSSTFYFYDLSLAVLIAFYDLSLPAHSMIGLIDPPMGIWVKCSHNDAICCHYYQLWRRTLTKPRPPNQTTPWIRPAPADDGASLVLDPQSRHYDHSITRHLYTHGSSRLATNMLLYAGFRRIGSGDRAPSRRQKLAVLQVAGKLREKRQDYILKLRTICRATLYNETVCNVLELNTLRTRSIPNPQYNGGTLFLDKTKRARLAALRWTPRRIRCKITGLQLYHHASAAPGRNTARADGENLSASSSLRRIPREKTGDLAPRLLGI